MGKNIYRYTFIVGTIEFIRWGLDDRKARRLMARWLRLRWNIVRANCHARYPGSLADEINNGTIKPPNAFIFKIWTNGITVPDKPHTLIEQFELTEMSMNEFFRVYAGY